jgi:hypothetical protein
VKAIVTTRGHAGGVIGAAAAGDSDGGDGVDGDGGPVGGRAEAECGSGADVGMCNAVAGATVGVTAGATVGLPPALVAVAEQPAAMALATSRATGLMVTASRTAGPIGSLPWRPCR